MNLRLRCLEKLVDNINLFIYAKVNFEIFYLCLLYAMQVNYSSLIFLYFLIESSQFAYWGISFNKRSIRKKMGHRLSKIYTKTGDAGTTGLADGSRVAKNDPLIAAIGDVDELNAFIGSLLCQPGVRGEVKDCLRNVQNQLFDVGSELAIPGSTIITSDYVDYIEANLDRLNDELAYLKEFILPGGHIAAAQAHVARTVCRRAERSIISLRSDCETSSEAAKYLNRLSDLLFVVARIINKDNNHPEPNWQKQKFS